MNDIQTTRRERLRDVVEKQGGAASVAKRLGVSLSYVSSQLLTGKRPITEKTARKIEQKLGLREGALDNRPASGAPPFDGVDHELLSRSMVAVADAMDAVGIRLDATTQARLVSAVYEHAVTAKTINPEFVKQLVRLSTR